jgi:hypothetical protein
MKTKNRLADKPKGSAADQMEKDLQEIMDDSVASEALGRVPMVAGRELRPITLASLALLKQAGSELISGVKLEDAENLLLDSCVFILLQSSTLEDATRLAFGTREQLNLEALKLADSIPPNEVHSFTDSIISMLMDATATQVKPMPRKGDKNSNPLGNS